jgi:hypothetical protein
MASVHNSGVKISLHGKGNLPCLFLRISESLSHCVVMRSRWKRRPHAPPRSRCITFARITLSNTALAQLLFRIEGHQIE